MLIQWKTDYEVGVADLDNDHRRLAELINELDAVLQSRPSEDALPILDRVVRHFTEHCAREEAVMERAGAATSREHAEDHARAQAKLAELTKRLAGHPTGPALEAVVSYLRSWFFAHVVGKDSQLRALYRAKGLASGKSERRGAKQVGAALSRFTVRTRIFAAALIPAIVAIVLAGTVLEGKRAVVHEMRQVEMFAAHAVKVGGLVHELQIERGLSALWLSGDDKVAETLRRQRQAVDGRRRLLSGDALGDGAQALAGLDDVRANAAARTIQAGDSSDRYSAMIADLLKGVGDLARAATDARIANKITSYIALTRGKEQAGQERAIGAVGFAGSFPAWRYKRFVERSAQQDSYFDIYLSLTDAGHRRSFHDAVAGRAMADYERMRNLAAVDLAAGAVDPQAWFAAATGHMETLAAAEHTAADDLAASASGIRAAAERDLAIIATVLGILLVVALTITLMIIRSVVSPFLALTSAILRIANGEKDIEVPAVERSDEIGEMARAVLIFRQALLANDAMMAEQSVETAFTEGRMERREVVTRNFDAKVSEFVGILASSSTELVATADEMTRIAGDTHDRSSRVATATQQTTTNIQTVAAAVEELSASVGEINRQVVHAADISAGAVQEAERTDTIVTSLADTAARIGEVVGLIDDIAGQTNLLALNATIEAARAGEAGKGFTVVAQEVKQLAHQTVRATDDIGRQLKAVQDSTIIAVQAIRDVSETVRKISGISANIASAVEQQSAATDEISRNVQEAALGVMEVSRNIVEVSQGASQTGSAATQVLQAANDVSGRSELIRAEVEAFLAEVRIA